MNRIFILTLILSVIVIYIFTQTYAPINQINHGDNNAGTYISIEVLGEIRFEGNSELHIDSKSNVVILIIQETDSIKILTTKFLGEDIMVNIEGLGSYAAVLTSIIEDGRLFLFLDDEAMSRLQLINNNKIQSSKFTYDENLNPKPKPPRRLPPFHW